MIRLRLRVLNLDAFTTEMTTKYPGAMVDGVRDGIQIDVVELEARIRNATPSRTGKGRESVFSQMTSAVSGVAGYDLDVAWWMNILVFGARSHPILARGLRGSRAARARGSHARKHAYGKDWQHIYDSVFWNGNALQSTGGNAKQALSLVVGGGRIARKMVLHPGIKKEGIPARQLDAYADQAVANIEVAISKRMSEV